MADGKTTGTKTAAKPPQAPAQQCPADEKAPGALTIYICDLPLGGDNPPMTGVYFPDKYTPGDQNDVIIYLHGFRDRCGSGNAAIDQYWKKDPFKLRELVNASGKNVMLVAPTLGYGHDKNGDYYNVPNMLSEDDGGDRFLRQLKAKLAARDPFKKEWKADTLKFNNVYLAAHSGGGWPMLKLASSIQKEGKVRECWGFDSMYGTKLGVSDLWTAVAKTGPKIFIYYLGSTQGNSESFRTKVKKLQLLDQSAFVVDCTDRDLSTPLGAHDHCQVPATFWSGYSKKGQPPRVHMAP